jgi:hypothetical protein
MAECARLYPRLSPAGLVVFTKPGAHDLNAMPGGKIPDQQPRAFPLGLQFGAALSQTLRRDVTLRTPFDKAQGHLIPKGGVSRSSLPQDSRAGQRKRLGIGLLPPLLDTANRLLVVLPDRGLRQSKATPPDLVEEANRPDDRLVLLRGPAQHSIASGFFLVPRIGTGDPAFGASSRWRLPVPSTQDEHTA